MDELRNKAKDLFEKGEIDLFIGYEEGTRNPRPLFASNAEETKKLVFNNKCTGNLAVYLTRKDLVKRKRVGISASYYALKSIVQLFVENQLKEENLKVFGLSDDGKIQVLNSLDEIKQYIKEHKYYLQNYLFRDYH